jgi:glycosyltransferase involved in cell wall biosynthesis
VKNLTGETTWATLRQLFLGRPIQSRVQHKLASIVTRSDLTDRVTPHSRPKLRIAIIFMPINEIRPPVFLNSLASSGDLVMDEMARRLGRSHKVIVYCALGEGQQRVEHFEGVEYRRISTWFDQKFLHRQKVRRLIDLVGFETAPQPLINSPLWYRHFIGEVIADASLLGCDIVHIMNISQFVPFIRARLPKTRVVLHMHCQWLEQLDAAVIERRLKAADLVLGVSNFIAAGVRRRFPSLAHRCSHVYNGADVALFARPPDVRLNPKQLLYVGRLAPEKGIHVLLDAFHIVLSQHPDAHLKIIGPEAVVPREALFPNCSDPHVLALEPYFRPGAYADLLRAKMSAFPPGSISFLNEGVKFTDLASHYHSASVFVFPSVCEEACPLSPIEAMASSLPVIATRDGPLPELVENGRSGLLVDRSNARALADAILQLLSNSDQRDAMAGSAFERASTRFSWDRITEDLLREYGRLFV